MRRMIDWIYEALLGLRIKSQDQHIADLEKMLKQALDDQLDINVEVTQLTQALLDAMARRDDMNDVIHKRRRVGDSCPRIEADAIDWSATN